MAPEQLEGKETDARTDLFAFGCVLYEMLTGRRAFAGESTASVISAVMTTDPPPISSAQPFAPPALERLLKACLAKDPDERRESAHDVAQELRGIAQGRGTPVTPDAPVIRRHRWVIPAAALLLLVVAAAVAFVGVLQWQRPRVHDPAPSKVPEANEYLRLAKLFSETQVDLPKAQQYLEKALALDPDFAQARAYYGETYMSLIDWGLSNDTSLLYRAEAEVSRALHDDPDSAKAYAALAAVYLYQGRKELVPQIARKAIELAADDKNGLLMLAICHQWSGEYQQSQVLAKRVMEAHPSFFAARVVSAENARLMGDTERSLREEGMVLEQDSKNVLSLLLIGLTYLTQGDTVKAREALALARGFEPQNYQVRVLWALLLAVEGRRGEALREMDVELLKYGKLIVVATNVAEFYAVLGDRAKALEWLDHAMRVGDERADWLERDPLLANIRTDPGFRQIVEGIHIRRKQLDKPAR